MLFNIFNGEMKYLGQVISIEEIEGFSDGTPYFRISTTLGVFNWVPNNYSWSTNFLVRPD